MVHARTSSPSRTPRALRAVAVVAAFASLTLAGSAFAKGKARKSAPKAAPAASADAGAAVMHKTLKRMIGAIRYKRNAKALAQFDGPAQGAFLGAAAWAKATPAQQTEFIALFHKMFAGIAFPNIQKNFKNLETVLYAAPKVRGNKATVDGTIVILHPMKKQEIKVTFDMNKTGATWKVVDVTVKGNKSMLTRIRDDQVQKILAKGGWPKLLELMRKRVAKLG